MDRGRPRDADRVPGRAALAWVAVLLLSWAWWVGRQDELADTGSWTGWVLLGLVLFLGAYNVRKRFVFLPVGSSQRWLGWHVHTGLFSVLVFLGHSWQGLPTGPFETLLGTLFLLTAVTGLVGLYLSRTLPPRLTQRGEEVLFERIPRFVQQLRSRADELVLGSVARTRSTSLASFYRARVAPFMERPSHGWRHLSGGRAPLAALHTEMESFRGTLAADEVQVFDELQELVHAKDDLDFHRSLQGALKLWLFVHIPLSLVLLLFVAAHVVVVHAFGAVP